MISVFRKTEIRLQFTRYVLIGFLTLLTDYLLLIFSVEILRLNVILAASISYVVSLLVHFNLNKYWNFKSFSRSYQRQIRTYLIASGFFYLINIAIIQSATILHFNYIVGKIIATGVLVSMTFMFNRYVTFRRGIRETLKVLYEKIRFNIKI